MSNSSRPLFNRPSTPTSFLTVVPGMLFRRAAWAWTAASMASTSLSATTSASASASASAGEVAHADGDVDWASLRCPEDDATTTLPTPTYGTKKGAFLICTEELIRAPPRAVYDAVLDFRRYGAWNTFVVDVGLPGGVGDTPAGVRVGLAMTLTTAGLIDGINTTSTEVVSALHAGDGDDDSGFLMNAWRVDDWLGGTMVAAEHPNVLVDQGGGFTRYLSYETYYPGLALPTVLLLRERLQERFVQQGRDLKAYLERP